MYIIALHSANSIKGCGHLVRTSLSRPRLSQMKFKRGSLVKFVSQFIMAVIAEYLFWKSSDSLKSTNEKEIRVKNSHQTSWSVDCKTKIEKSTTIKSMHHPNSTPPLHHLDPRQCGVVKWFAADADINATCKSSAIGHVTGRWASFPTSSHILALQGGVAAWRRSQNWPLSFSLLFRPLPPPSWVSACRILQLLL